MLAQATMDPSANICAGVRWLFMKRAIAVERFNHAKSDHVVTWDDAVAEYKGLLKDIVDKKDNPDPLNEMQIFRHFYEQLLGSLNETTNFFENSSQNYGGKKN